MFNEQVNTRTNHIQTAQNGNPRPTEEGGMPRREVVLRSFLCKLDPVHPGESAPEVGLTHASYMCSGPDGTRVRRIA